MDKYKNGTDHTGYFHRGSNNNLILITCKYRLFIPSNLQICVLHWHHMYLLRPGMDGTEDVIHQYLYWPDIRDAVQKEVTNRDTCQPTKQSNRRYGKLPAKLDEEIPWDKLCCI